MDYSACTPNNTYILIQTKLQFLLQVFFEEHNLIIMDYSACTPKTVCYYCSISFISSSSWFYFCTLLFTNEVSVLYSMYLFYFQARPSGSLPLLCLYPSLLVPKITFPDTLWCISRLLYSSLGLPGLILQIHLFQAPNISIYSLLYLFFPSSLGLAFTFLEL